MINEGINHKHNNSIGCDVSECVHHCSADNYCSLDKIEVSKNGSTIARNPDATECASFNPQNKLS